MSDSQITIFGNATRDPELRFTQSGMQVCTVGVAVNHRKKDGEDDTSFLDVTCFGQMAENVAESVKKGTRVVAAGRLSVRTYEKRDGGQGYSVEVVADEVGLSLRFATGEAKKTAVSGGRSEGNGGYRDAGTRTYDAASSPF